MQPASTNGIVVYLLRPYTILDMRGGGPVNYSASRPPLGAGVLQWLEDSDHEAEEAAELARRLNEQAILVDQLSPSPPSGSTNWPTRDLPPPLVTGQNAGQSIVVCMDCFRDVATVSIAGNRACCGAAICMHCAGDNCARCRPRVGHDVVTISLAQSLGQHREASAIGIADSSHPCNTLATWDDILRSQGAVEDEGSGMNAWGHGSTPPDIEAMEEGPIDLWHEPCSGDMGTRCTSCGVSAAFGYTQWRICRCTAVYCIQCAANPCVDCPAMFVLREQGVSEHYATTVPNPGETTVAELTTYDDAPMTLTPEEAAARRTRLMSEKLEERSRRKLKHREQRRRQIQGGLRPKREKPPRRPVRFGTINVTDASTWRREFENGPALRSIDYLMVQEHGQYGDDQTEATTKWLRGHGCDPIVDSAYIKRTDPGGGARR